MTIRDLFHQFRYFDWFGNMTNFHMKGSTNYQTKIGALFSLAWLTIILSAYVFYFNRLMSRDDPAVGFNKYIGDKYPEVDLVEQNHNFFFITRYRKNEEFVKWDDFWGSFTLYGSIYTFGDEKNLNSTTVPKNLKHSWEKIDFVKCST